MAKGIKDKVVILGMGCSKFGERWDKEADNLMVENPMSGDTAPTPISFSPSSSARSCCSR